ncbi:hypothetical protein [Bradyrhizobium sp. STM 3809]|uniref:hypothetical protein n=1 Tax=Bradyrhizobium sp. STM 3809 TaxID=551936 RepID=UPI0002E054D5|nr:hypothetical protein [Bradyrhizobium sp. STM 3809]
MMLLAGLLLIALVITWLGTDYVLNHVVTPLIDDGRLQRPDLRLMRPAATSASFVRHAERASA